MPKDSGFFEAKRENEEAEGRLIAKKDFVLSQNEFHRHIKKGDDVSDVPEHLMVALKTEQVID